MQQVPAWVHSAAPRRGEAGITYAHPDFPDMAVTVGDDGILRPASPDEVRLADRLGLPIIHEE